MDKILTKERRNALGSLLTNWFSEQDNDARMLDTFNYFDVDKIDALIDEAIAPTIADAVMCATAALASDAAGAPIYQTCFIQGQWRDVDRAEYERAVGLRADLARIVYAVPVAPAAPEGWKLVPIEPTEEMINAARDVAVNWSDGFPRHAEGYAAMLAAAPQAPVADAARADPVAVFDERAAFDLKVFEAALWALVNQSRSWEKAYRDLAVDAPELDNHKSSVEGELRYLLANYRTQLDRERSVLQQLQSAVRQAAPAQQAVPLTYDEIMVPRRVVELLKIIRRDGLLKRAGELQEVYRRLDDALKSHPEGDQQ